VTRRMMARPAQGPPTSSRQSAGLIAVAAVVVVIGLLAVSGIFAGNGPSLTSAPGSGVATVPGTLPAGASADPHGNKTPLTSPDANGSVRPSTPVTTVGSGGTPLPSAPPTEVSTPVPGGAPTSPEGFDLAAQVIPIGFPLRADTRYEYRDNFLDLRDGPPDDYNHARIREDGTAVRLHDGIDIYADEDEPLIAVFDGTVIAARERWQPWEPDRYGQTIVIVSDETQTAGYVALYAHADRVWVEPGEHVSRGQVVGTLGRTGNAEVQSIRSHLHFELRAPFLLDWSPMGEQRQVDAFNPYPSLRASDPKRT
jgi:murein DD-endopeptidase MepM/ murein hydrolase activator NlpD